MPIVANREYRAILPFQAKNEEKRLQTDYYVEGYATTFDKPYLMYEYDGVQYFEVIDRHAFDSTDMSDVIMQFDHQGMVYARTSNKTLLVGFDEKGLFNAADLSKTSGSKELYESISAGLVTQMSMAFTVSQESYNKDTKTRKIEKVKKLYDVSAVSYPANPDTEIMARSFIDGVIEREKQELRELQKTLELAKAKYYYIGGK